MKKNTRKGFTLVELLIVIVVIGVLSAMMTISSTEAVSSAKAATIISNLRNLKTAALQLYFDSIDQWNVGTERPSITTLWNYVNSSDVTGEFSYGLAFNDTKLAAKDVNWYITCNLASAKIASTGEIGRIADKLERRASQAGLLTGTISSVTISKEGPYTSTGATNHIVAIKVR